jgi:hypothetical protein
MQKKMCMENIDIFILKHWMVKKKLLILKHWFWNIYNLPLKHVEAIAATQLEKTKISNI